MLSRSRCYHVLELLSFRAISVRRSPKASLGLHVLKGAPRTELISKRNGGWPEESPLGQASEISCKPPFLLFAVVSLFYAVIVY